MSKSFSESYKEAGVDITAGYKSVELMKEFVGRTLTNGASINGDIGGFGGLFELDIKDTPNPVLVSGTDGVGTKLKLAFLMDRHDTVGIDCVAMCVNDILCVGAKPLYFLDYIACGKNFPEKIAEIVKGVSEGCIQSDSALIGGETAEMPGFYPEDEYDLAGFAVGVVDKNRILDKSKVREGDVLIALPSSGVHSNGFSLVRKIFDVENSDISSPIGTKSGEFIKEALENNKGGNDIMEIMDFANKSLGEVLLTPTKIYVKPMLALFDRVNVKSVAHITGGGFYENIPRSLPDGFGVEIEKKNIKILPIFNLISREGDIPERDMFNTFNMGVGMTVIVSPEDAEEAINILQEKDEKAYILGRVVKGEKEVNIYAK